MAGASLTRNLDATPEQLWPYLADAGRWMEWMPGLEACAVTGGPSEGVGRRQHLRIDLGGHRGEIDLEITEWEPEARIGWIHLADRIEGMERPVTRDVRTRITLAPAAGGTAIAFEAGWEPVGLVGRMVSGTLVKGRVTAMFEREAENLERLARDA